MTPRPVTRDELTPAQMAERLAPKVQRVASERNAARDERRNRFPLMAEFIDMFRAAGMDPKPVHAINGARETWGREPPPEGLAVDGDKLAHLPALEASWRAFFAGQKEDHKTYRERMQRAIRPETRGIDEP